MVLIKFVYQSQKSQGRPDWLIAALRGPAQIM